MSDLKTEGLLPIRYKPKNILFNGELNNSKKEKLDVSVDLEYDEFDFSTLKCKLICRDHESVKFDEYLKNNDSLNITGRISNDELILIDIVSWTRIEGNVAEVEVNFFTKGYKGKIPFENGKYFALIVLDDAPAVHIGKLGPLSYLGSISSKRKDNDAISWETEIGKFSLADYFDYEKSEISNGKLITQIKRTKILIEKQFNYSIDINKLIVDIENELEDVINLLSFISRKPINWHEIKLTIYSEGDNQFVFNFEKRRKDYLRKKLNEEQIFHQTNLREGLFFELLKEYKKSLYKEQIKRTIQFITTSNIDDSLEPSFQSVFSALEIITTACSEKLKINNMFEEGQEVRLKTILKEIKKLIEIIYKRENWGMDRSFKEINEKISELKRRPFVNKLIDAIKLSKIRIIDIWYVPEEIYFNNKLKEIIKRRNKIIHSGEIIDYPQLYRDKVRIQAITERLLLFLLNHNEIKDFYFFCWGELQSLHGLP
jgi:hypothetical protein